MNYLAHFYLSFEQEPLIVGNLLGDFVRGRLEHPRNQHYNAAVKQGILLHRHIDFFTDTHPTGQECRKVLPARFSKFRGVVTDMYFDYFLAKYFRDYSTFPLHEFAVYVYEILDKNRRVLPPEAASLAETMKKYDWLYNYQFEERMIRSFVGMSQRFPFLKGIETAGEELFANEQVYADYFRTFFPDLVHSCEDFLGSD